MNGPDLARSGDNKRDDLEVVCKNWVRGIRVDRNRGFNIVRPGDRDNGATGRFCGVRMQPSGLAKCCCVAAQAHAGLVGRDYVFALTMSSTRRRHASVPCQFAPRCRPAPRRREPGKSIDSIVQQDGKFPLEG